MVDWSDPAHVFMLNCALCLLGKYSYSDVNSMLDNCMISATVIHLSYLSMWFSLHGHGGGDIAIVKQNKKVQNNLSDQIDNLLYGEKILTVSI